MSKNTTAQGRLPAAELAKTAGDSPAKRHPAGFNVFRSVEDEKSYFENASKGAKLVISGGYMGGHYVPVSFVAKDWNVTPRRIRALLTAGRLLGRLQDNGYWEVRFPYSFTFGTRGPSLKRQQRPPKRPRPSTENTAGNRE